MQGYHFSKSRVNIQEGWEKLYKRTPFLLHFLLVLYLAWSLKFLITPRMDFFNELWAPVYLLVHGQSPYDTASLNPALPAAWFPMAIGFFFPLGWLSEETALRIWFVLSILALCGITILALDGDRTWFAGIALTLFGFLFPPFLNHLYLGQISIIITACVMIAAYFVERDRPWLAACALALALSKPHLTILPMLGLCLYYLQHGGIKSMIAFIGKVTLASFIMVIPLFVAEPNWIPDALVSMTNNPFWMYPSLFIVYLRFFPGFEWLLWGLTFAFVFLLTWFLWLKLPVKQAAYWSLALAPLASPYVGSWDFVVLIPIFFFAFIQSNWKRKAFMALSYGLAWAGMALVQMQPGSDNHFFWWVPLWFVANASSSLYWNVPKTDSFLAYK